MSRAISRSLVPAAMFLALLLAGCASTRGLAPELDPADADTLATRRSLPGASDAHFPAGDWWKAFDDPQLDALITEALLDAPSLAIADARARQAAAQAGLADAIRKPAVAATAQYAGVLLPESIAPEPLGGQYRALPRRRGAEVVQQGLQRRAGVLGDPPEAVVRRAPALRAPRLGELADPPQRRGQRQRHREARPGVALDHAAEPVRLAQQRTAPITLGRVGADTGVEVLEVHQSVLGTLPSATTACSGSVTSSSR